MRLSEFILANREPILKDWEAFAETCAPASSAMGTTALRDHASEMLTVISADLAEPQNSGEQTEKSKGNAPTESKNTAAEAHGADRAESGFSVEQMVSEYRALRASVIRLWTEAQGELTVAELEDFTRFNEAIDQSLAESVTRYTQELDRSKELFLAILGHDLRTPIGAVSTAAKFMLETKELVEPHLTLTTRIASSSGRMNHLVGDLLDFTRSRLGGGIPIVREEMDIGKAVHDVVSEMEVVYPGRKITVDARGTHQGEWDCARISQVLTNLIGNAIEHGSADSPVTIAVDGEERATRIAIHNLGPSIPPEKMNGIFNPMKGGDPTSRVARGPSGNLGLGLYIADRIVTAHEGTIEIESSEATGTTFTVKLPRQAKDTASGAPAKG